jgi:2-haloalkanoic acid dehalogenase type II
MTAVVPSDIDILSFDCYGTLIDWERGIAGALSPLFMRSDRTLLVPAVLASFAEIEARAEQPPWRSYREVLALCTRGIARRFGIALAPGEEHRLSESIGKWPPFPDSAECLARLRGRYRLAVLSNVDRDLFEATQDALGRPFDLVITAEDVGSYKPDPANFRHLIESSDVEPGRILHCAQSRYHDIGPAREAGMHTVWVRRGQKGGGAVPDSDAKPHVTVETLSELCALLGVP